MQQEDPLLLVLGHHHPLLLGQRAHRVREPLVEGQGILETPPEHKGEVGGHLMGQAGGQRRLADAANPHDRDLPAPVCHDPPFQRIQLLAPPVEQPAVRCIPPVLVPTRPPGAALGHDTGSPPGVVAGHGRGQPGEPAQVQHPAPIVARAERQNLPIEERAQGGDDLRRIPGRPLGQPVPQTRGRRVGEAPFAVRAR